MPSFFTFYPVAQYNTPSYYHKTFENKLNWINLVTKTFFLHSLSKLSNFLKYWENHFYYWAHLSIHTFIWEVLPWSKNKAHYYIEIHWYKGLRLLNNTSYLVTGALWSSLVSGQRVPMGFAVPAVWGETNHEPQRAMEDFLKMAESLQKSMKMTMNELLMKQYLKPPKRRHSLG